jgi:hypothetical protein
MTRPAGPRDRFVIRLPRPFTGMQHIRAASPHSVPLSSSRPAGTRSPRRRRGPEIVKPATGKGSPGRPLVVFSNEVSGSIVFLSPRV